MYSFLYVIYLSNKVSVFVWIPGGGKFLMLHPGWVCLYTTHANKYIIHSCTKCMCTIQHFTRNISFKLSQKNVCINVHTFYYVTVADTQYLYIYIVFIVLYSSITSVLFLLGGGQQKRNVGDPFFEKRKGRR